MTTWVVLGVLWTVVGVPPLVRAVQDRREPPMEEFRRAMGALGRPHARFLRAGTYHPAPSSARRAAARRRLVSVLTYTPGAGLVAAGLALREIGVIAAGLALTNLGTSHRLLALARRATADRRRYS
jgi:hypothetical protein